MSNIFENNGIVDITEIKDDEPKSILLYDGGNCLIPKYSIIIPTYNRNESMLRSLRSAINQTYNNTEIIIVDNNDDFDSKTVLNLVKMENCPKVKYFKNEKNLGAERNFNRGIQLASGEYVALLHDDDYWELNFLDEIDKRISGNMAIYTIINTVYENKYLEERNIVISAKRNKFRKYVLHKTLKILYKLNPNKNKISNQDAFESISPVGVIGAVYNKSALLQIGGFNPKFYPGTDYELNCRYINKFGGKLFNIKLANYVVGENDSLIAAKQFPIFNYNLRGLLMLNGFVKNSKKNEKKRNLLYNIEVYLTEKSWGVETVKVGKRLKNYSSRTVDYYNKSRYLRKFIKFN